MKIVAIAGSNNANSINKALLGYVSKQIKNKDNTAEVELLDLNDYEMPFYNAQLEETSGAPQKAGDLLQKFADADAIVVSLAEYNGTFTGVWKNTFDWMSRIERNVFADKPVTLLAASPGPRSGAGVLGAAEQSYPRFGAEILSVTGIGTFHEKFDFGTGELTDPEAKKSIEETIETLLTKLA